MSKSGEKRRTDRPNLNSCLSFTKKARGVSTSNEGFKVSAGLQRENDELRCELKSTQDAFNQLQTDKDCRLNGKQSTEGETKNFPDSAKENYQRMLEVKLLSSQSQLNERDLKIVRLESNAVEAEKLRLDLETRVEKMQQQLCKELEGSGSYADGAATPFLLESTLKAVQTFASSFTKVFLEHSKRYIVDVNLPLKKHFQNTYLTRPGHVSYLLRAWTFETLFQDFENEGFSCGGASSFLDHNERRQKYFEYFQLLQTNNALILDPQMCNLHWFEHFRSEKLREFLSLWQSSDEVTAGNLSSDALEDPGAMQESKASLMESFSSVAKGVWALHKLSFSFQTRAEIFRVSERTEFYAEYMDSVVTMEDDESFVSKVGFMICPGFRLKRSVVKCQIYLAGEPNRGDLSC